MAMKERQLTRLSLGESSERRGLAH